MKRTLLVSVLLAACGSKKDQPAPAPTTTTTGDAAPAVVIDAAPAPPAPPDAAEAAAAAPDAADEAPTDAAPTDGIAKLTQPYQDVRSVPWETLAYNCGDSCKAKVHKVIYGDVDGDKSDEAVVVVQGASESENDHTAHLYGVKDGAVAWLGRVQTGGREHPDYAPHFIKAKLGGGAVKITWTWQLWGHCDDPDDCTETATEEYGIEDGQVVAR